MSTQPINNNKSSQTTKKTKIKLAVNDMPEFHVRNYEQPLSEQIAYYIERALQWKAALKHRKRPRNQHHTIEFVLPSVRKLANFFVCPISTVVNALVDLREHGYTFEVKGFDLPLYLESAHTIQALATKKPN